MEGVATCCLLAIICNLPIQALHLGSKEADLGRLLAMLAALVTPVGPSIVIAAAATTIATGLVHVEFGVDAAHADGSAPDGIRPGFELVACSKIAHRSHDPTDDGTR